VVHAEQIEALHAARKDAPWPPRHLLFGVPVSATNEAEAESSVLAAARAGRPALVDHLSVHGLSEAQHDPSFREALTHFDLVAPDGQPVRWALNLLFGTKLRDRVYGPALMERLCARAAKEEIGVYLYGGRPEVLSRLRERLLGRHPGLRIVGAESPPFRALTPEEDAAVVERIERSGAGLVFIGLGCPKQELFAAAHVDRIHAVQLCVGAAFDFLAGVKPMAPRWMQDRGLEWLFRLASEPRRLWRRYLVANSIFVAQLGRELLRRGMRARITKRADSQHTIGEGGSR
jgi:exopolysaccharide biosynthesis WecB/TagA/CpsF family protein